MRIESEEVTESLNGNAGAGDKIILRNHLLEKGLQGLPGAAAEIGKKFSIIQEVTTKYLRNTEDEMPVGDLLEDIHAEPFTEFDHTLLMTGWTEMAVLAGKCQEIFMATILALHAGKTVMENTAVQIPVDDFLDIGTEKSILPFKSFLINLEKGFKMILHAPVIVGRLRVSWTIHSGGSSYDFSPLRISDREIIERSFCLSRENINRKIV